MNGDASYVELMSLVGEVGELRLQLVQGKKESQSDLVRGKPWASGSRGESKNPITRAAQSGVVAEGQNITILVV